MTLTSYCPKPKDARFVDLTGKRFNRWKVLGFAGRDKSGNRVWKCRCDCGTLKTAEGSHLKGGGSKSCGCLSRERSRIHGGTINGGTPEYKSWSGMLDRCRNPQCPRYDRYGARGIKVCCRWHKFVNFLSDMGRRPSLNHSIERIDNNGSYKPSNCKWATQKEQMNNCNRNVLFTHNGKTQSMTMWAEELRVSYRNIIQRRSKLGWSLGKSILTPCRKYTATS